MSSYFGYVGVHVDTGFYLSKDGVLDRRSVLGSNATKCSRKDFDVRGVLVQT